MTGLTPDQKQQYASDGYTILRAAYSPDECTAVIDHMMDLKAGRKTLEGFRTDDDEAGEAWKRTHNQHVYDPVALDLLIDPRLRHPLTDCLDDDPDGIQTMYFWKGSEQHWHQDQYYLPACMSAWIALVDVGEHNGTIWVQPGSHNHRLLKVADLVEKYGEHELGTFDPRYDIEIDALVEANREEHGFSEIPVEVNAGDVVLFHGRLIHRGGPVGKPGSFRHVMASHYIPYNFHEWPWEGWARYSFDGERREVR